MDRIQYKKQKWLNALFTRMSFAGFGRIYAVVTSLVAIKQSNLRRPSYKSANNIPANKILARVKPSDVCVSYIYRTIEKRKKPNDT